MSHALLENPVLILLIVFLPSLFLLRGIGRRATRKLSVLCGVVCIAVFAFATFLNITQPGFYWHDEANILGIAAAYVHGEPLYHARSAPALYSLLYGPSTFLVYAPFLSSAARPILAIRIGMLAINLASLMLLFFILRGFISRAMALALLTLATAFLLSMPAIVFGTRGDPWLLFCFCLALFCALRLNWLLAALASGIFSGLALDFKITVAPVVCLLLAILYRKHGFRALLTAGVTTLTCALSLFLLPRISLPNYLDWLLLSGQQSLLRSNFIDNLLAAAFLISAGLLLRLCAAPPQRRSTFGIAIPVLCAFALAISILTGSKDGAGAWHLWPMLPFLLLWAASEAATRGVDAPPDEAAAERTSAVVAALALAATVVTLRYGVRDLRLVHPSNVAQQRAAQRAAEDKLAALSERFPDHNLAMGYGRDLDYRSSLRFELPLHHQDYFLDENALVEAIKAGIPVPPGVVQRVLGCTDIWLVPHGQTPFSTLRASVLPTDVTPYLFPDSIRLHFTETHTLFESGDIYDLWTCPTTPRSTQLTRPD